MPVKMITMAMHSNRALNPLWVLLVSLICTTIMHTQVAAEQQQQGNSKAKLPHVYRNAHILISRDTHTVVPLRSIIYQPSKNQSRVVELPSGKFRFWPAFLAKNRDWLLTFEVTLDQAKGEKPIPESKLEEFAKIHRTVIATYRQNPISVRPYKGKEDSPSKTQQ